MMNTVVTKEHEIIVNGRPRKWVADTISFEQAVELAFPGLPPDANRVFTVAYKKGKQQGTLVAGESVEVESGMVFNVAYSDKS